MGHLIKLNYIKATYIQNWQKYNLWILMHIIQEVQNCE